MNRLLPNLLWLGALTALLAVTIAPLARATDDKTYPASMCDLHIPGKTIRPNHGTLFNYYYDFVYADCPIVRDNIHNTNGTKAVWVRASDDLDDGNKIVCTLMATSMYGDDIEWNQAEQDGWWQGSLYLDVDISYSLGYYHLGCKFPLESEFYGYRVSEYD